MNTKRILLVVATAVIILNSNLNAGEPVSNPDEGGKKIESSDSLWGDPRRPDGHAPIGVTGDHTHGAGGFMTSYRYMYMEMGDLRNGTNDISSSQLFATTPYAVAPTGMSMEMHMLGVMYGLTDHLTLMAMTGYQFKEMKHLARPGSPAEAMFGSTFRKTTEGWSDLTLGGLLKIYDADNQRVHLNLGFSAPTGELTERAYPMHSSTGTWDLLPGITWLWQNSLWSGGAQVTGRIHLDENDLGFAFGDSLKATTWVSRILTDQFSASARVSLENTGSIQGIDKRFPGPNFMAPPMDPANHGGTWGEAGLGLNYMPMKGYRFGVEALLPFFQDLNGPQMQRDWMFNAGFQKSF